MKKLRQEGMRMESASKSGAEISGDTLRRMGKYAYSNIKQQKNGKRETEQVKRDPFDCFCCGNQIRSSIQRHRAECPARSVKCHNCKKVGHFAKLCKSKTVRQNELESNNDGDSEEEPYKSYNVNIFRTKKSTKSPHMKLLSRIDNKDFAVEVVVNNNLGTVIADTGARVSVCGTKQAKAWNLLEKMVPTKTKIKPYNSTPIDVYGVARCAVTFGATSIPVEWHILSGSCDPILSGEASSQLGIIRFNSKPSTYQPIRMINQQLQPQGKQKLQSILEQFPGNFNGLGKLRNHQIKLHVDTSIKPVTVPPRSVPYHLKDRVDKAIGEMIQQDVIEEHPPNEPAPWVSCAVVAPN